MQDRGGRRSGGRILCNYGKSLIIFVGGLMLGLYLTGHITALASDQSSPSHPIITEDDGIPDDLHEIFEKVAAEYDLCPELLEAMAYRESRFIPTVKSGNHYGLMQINVKVHADRINKFGWTSEDMYDPEKNITVAADLLAELFETYGDDDPVILGIYSGNWKAVSYFKETGIMCSYMTDVLSRSAIYERMHGK
jgi:hypothetical protein